MDRAFTEDQDKLIASEYTAGNTPTQLVEKWGGSTASVARAAKRGGARIRRKNEWSRLFTDEEELAIALRYRAGESITTLSKLLKSGESSIHRILLRNGEKTRSSSETWRMRCPLREDAFDCAETDPDASYWTGFLMADGSIIVSPRGWSPSITFSLKQSDEGHVAAFGAFLGSSNKLVSDYSAAGFNKSGGYNVKIAFKSRRLADSLARYGVVPNKTTGAKVLLLENNRHFWRGCVDGDGWLGMTTSRQCTLPYLGLCGALPLVEQFAEFVRGIVPKCKAVVRSHYSIWKFVFSGRYALEVIRHLYGDGKLSLPRKQLKADECLRWKPSTRLFDWDRISHEVLDGLLAEHGKWANVARHLGVSQNSLHQWRHDNKKLPTPLI